MTSNKKEKLVTCYSSAKRTCYLAKRALLSEADLSLAKERIEMEHGSSEKGDTWPKILKYNYEKYGDTRRAMRHKHHGIWQPYTWKDYYLM